MPDITEVIPEKQDGEFVRFPDSPFELFQPYPPAGDQPEAINKLVEGLRDGEAFQTLLGVTGSGKTFTMANVIARMGRPAIVFAPNKTLAAQLYSEFREFFPKNAVEYFVSYYDYYQPEAYVPPFGRVCAVLCAVGRGMGEPTLISYCMRRCCQRMGLCVVKIAGPGLCQPV